MGLVQRAFEAAGLATVILSNVPELTAAVSAPRIAAIEYPFGCTFGQPGDRDGQLAVLRGALQALESIDTPGGVLHLPFEWAEQDGAPSHGEPPPIAKYLMRHPLQVRNLIKRQVPEKYQV